MPLDLRPDIPPGMDDMNVNEFSRLYMTIKKICDEVNNYVNNLSVDKLKASAGTKVPTVIQTEVSEFDEDESKADVIIPGVKSDSVVMISPQSDSCSEYHYSGVYVKSYEFNKVTLGFSNVPRKAINVNIMIM